MIHQWLITCPQFIWVCNLLTWSVPDLMKILLVFWRPPNHAIFRLFLNSLKKRCTILNELVKDFIRGIISLLLKLLRYPYIFRNFETHFVTVAPSPKMTGPCKHGQCVRSEDQTGFVTFI